MPRSDKRIYTFLLPLVMSGNSPLGVYALDLAWLPSIHCYP